MSHGHEHVSNISRIWVFGILSAVTIVEVILGIYKPDSLHFSQFLGSSLSNWFYGPYYFKSAHNYAIYNNTSMTASKTPSSTWLISTIPLTEGNYIWGFKDSTIKWNFNIIIQKSHSRWMPFFLFLYPNIPILMKKI
jgi:hypothetical protein